MPVRKNGDATPCVTWKITILTWNKYRKGVKFSAIQEVVTMIINSLWRNLKEWNMFKIFSFHLIRICFRSDKHPHLDWSI